MSQHERLKLVFIGLEFFVFFLRITMIPQITDIRNLFISIFSAFSLIFKVIFNCKLIFVFVVILQ